HVVVDGADRAVVEQRDVRPDSQTRTVPWPRPLVDAVGLEFEIVLSVLSGTFDDVARCGFGLVGERGRDGGEGQESGDQRPEGSVCHKVSLVMRGYGSPWTRPRSVLPTLRIHCHHWIRRAGNRSIREGAHQQTLTGARYQVSGGNRLA